MIYIILGLVLIFVFNSIVLLLEQKYIINIQYFRIVSFIIYFILFTMLYAINFTRLTTFIRMLSFMDLLFIYFSFIFFYQFCSLLKVISFHKIQFSFKITKNKLFVDFLDIIHLLLFTSVIFPVLDLQFSQLDLFLMLLTTLIYTLVLLIEVKSNLLNIKINIVIENSIRCFLSLVVQQSCQNLFVVFLFILITKIYDYYKFTGITKFSKEAIKNDEK